MNTENQRIAYGETLVELGKADERIVVLEADLGKSTMSCFFGEAFPGRYFQMGIAEQNMMSVAAGLALTGKTAFVNSFAVFASGRAYDQFRQTIAISRLNVKVCGSSAGLSDFGDGATHQAIEDIAIMRAIPNVTVLCPADSVETAKMTQSMAKTGGPMYMRLNRNPCPVVTDAEAPFEMGKIVQLKDGGDVAIFAMGIMVGKALKAAAMLAGEGIGAKVLNVSTVKPLDKEAVIAAAKGMKAVVTAEEHTIVGGLGSAIAEALRGERARIEFVGIDDRFGTTARDYDGLLAHYGLTDQAIVGAVRKTMG